MLGLTSARIFNQYFDLEEDKTNHPKRPIPAGVISKRMALVISGILWFVTFSISAIISITFFFLTLLLFIISTTYSAPPLYIKKIFPLNNFSLAIFWGGITLLWGAVTQKGDAPLEILFFFLIYEFFAINSKDYLDVKGDKTVNRTTLPILVGKKNSLKVDMFCMSLPFLYGLATHSLLFYPSIYGFSVIIIGYFIIFRYNKYKLLPLFAMINFMLLRVFLILNKFIAP